MTGKGPTVSGSVTVAEPLAGTGTSSRPGTATAPAGPTALTEAVVGSPAEFMTTSTPPGDADGSITYHWGTVIWEPRSTVVDGVLSSGRVSTRSTTTGVCSPTTLTSTLCGPGGTSASPLTSTTENVDGATTTLDCAATPPLAGRNDSSTDASRSPGLKTTSRSFAPSPLSPSGNHHVCWASAAARPAVNP